MKRITNIMLVLVLSGCGGLELDEDFDIPRTEAFAPALSSYGIYQADMASLVPAPGVQLYELSSALFTDYAYKQRLLKLPSGQMMQASGTRAPNFPEGTVIAKTFYYPNDERTPTAGQRVIETRLLVLREAQWNSATYIWNEGQDDAVLSLDGATTEVSWVDAAGTMRTTQYEVPNEVACVSCHQSNEQVTLLGVEFSHLNRDVERNGATINQWAHFEAEGLINSLDETALPAIVDYRDTSLPLEQRARAYLDINCSHCHNPQAWELPADQGLDFRYETSLEDSDIEDEATRMSQLISEGEMPYIGTTLLHTEGVELLLEYLEQF